MFDSLYMSTDELLQAMYVNSACYLHGINISIMVYCIMFIICRGFSSEIFNRRLSEALGSENACSFQSLLYYLTTGSQYLLESAVCRVFTSEDAMTVVNFIAYCG